jgi:small nuclear ribonucleoprotein D1
MKLVRFLKKLKGEVVRIETKEKSTIEGKIDCVEKTMNIRMTKAKIHRGKDILEVPSHTVRGTSIRYIILPDELSLDPLLVDDRNRVRDGKRKKESDERPKMPRMMSRRGEKF